VIGRVFLVIWPPAQLTEVPIPATFTPLRFAAAAAPQVRRTAHGQAPLAAHGDVPPAGCAHLPLARR
jgi:hypothetical protein